MITPSPVAELTNRPRHPREVRERMQGEKMIPLFGEQALQRLILDCKFPEEKARRLLNIAWEFGQKAEPCPGGYVHIWYHGQDGSQHIFSVIEHFGKNVRIPLANSDRRPYTDRNSSANTDPRRRTKMPPRRSTAKPATPEPEVTETAPTSKLDRLEKYLTGNLTATHLDYVEWFTENVGEPTEIDADRLISLAVTFYGEFQASDFNRERREARRAAREAGNGQAEPEPEPEPAAKPAGRAGGRGARSAAKPAAAKPAAAKPAGRSRAAATSGAAVY